ncbi:hypothetical protein ABW19_dt0208079 [Dactylella cylindrospora]|nr:hypothetical protein ABW19_dt0208079 [Dactylella cylindrospora]
MPPRKTAKQRLSQPAPYNIPPVSTRRATRSQTKAEGITLPSIPADVKEIAEPSAVKEPPAKRRKVEANNNKDKVIEVATEAQSKKRKPDPQPIAAAKKQKTEDTSTASSQTTKPVPQKSTKKIALPKPNAKEIGITSRLYRNARILFSLFLAANIKARIGYSDISRDVTRHLIDVGWGDPVALASSTSSARMDELQRKGIPIDELHETAWHIKECALFCLETFDIRGDFNNLAEVQEYEADAIRDRLMELKGVDDYCIDLFFYYAQPVWKFLGPFSKPRDPLGFDDDD